MDNYVATPALDTRAGHAEGPMWDARRDELLWVDQFAGLVHRATWSGTRLELVTTYSLGVPVGAVVPVADPDGGWLVAAGLGFGRLGVDGGLTMLAEPETDTNRMNDGKCDPYGRFLAGSMAWTAAAGAGNLHRWADGDVETLLSDVTVSNGLAWSADGSAMYYIDTPTRRVDVFDYAPEGRPANRRQAVAIEEDHGSPDGMCIDDEGCLWVAMWGGGTVRRYAPTGEPLAVVTVADAPQVSSCAFAGNRLFITTSQERYTDEDKARHPNAGRLFTVELPVGGPPAASAG